LAGWSRTDSYRVSRATGNYSVTAIVCLLYLTGHNHPLRSLFPKAFEISLHIECTVLQPRYYRKQNRFWISLIRSPLTYGNHFLFLLRLLSMFSVHRRLCPINARVLYLSIVGCPFGYLRIHNRILKTVFADPRSFSQLIASLHRPLRA